MFLYFWNFSAICVFLKFLLTILIQVMQSFMYFKRQLLVSIQFSENTLSWTVHCFYLCLLLFLIKQLIFNIYSMILTLTWQNFSGIDVVQVVIDCASLFSNEFLNPLWTNGNQQLFGLKVTFSEFLKFKFQSFKFTKHVTIDQQIYSRVLHLFIISNSCLSIMCFLFSG